MSDPLAGRRDGRDRLLPEPLAAGTDDPRRRPPSADDDLLEADRAAEPAVPRPRDGLVLAAGAVALLVLAVAVFLWLSSGRRKAAEGGLDASSPPSIRSGADLPAAPLPLAAPAAAAGPIAAVPAPQFTTNNSVPVMAAPAMAAPAPMTGALAPVAVGAVVPAAAGSVEQRRRAPALVVDLGGEAPARPGNAVSMAAPAAPFAPAVTAAAAQDAQAAAGAVSAEERFAARVGGADNERAVATRLRNPAFTVPEGATIAATLETALDSDLPGYARAVVSRDVRAFDGRAVLIPRGSRVIGQYKAATALGAARVFVIWTRLIRPDGGAVQLSSPAADDLGRAGLGGRVDSHFFSRFGGAILLSVLNAGTAALASSQTGAQVYIGNSSDATSAAAAAIAKDGSRPPTIRTPQGAAVNIFVARDLDFSLVGPAR